MKDFHKNSQNNLFPEVNLEQEEIEYIQTISDIYEKKQIDCINQAKEFAHNPSLYENIYKTHFQTSYDFCQTFKIPTKLKSSQSLIW